MNNIEALKVVSENRLFLVILQSHASATLEGISDT